MRELLYLVVAPMTTYLGIAAFTAWWSAAMFVSVIALVAVLAVRRHEKHHRSGVYNDSLSSERMESARRWLVED